jgi:hypothetical protein
MLLRSGGAGANPAWSPYTLALPGAVGAVLYSDGTNWTRSAAPSLLALTLYGQSAGGGAQLSLGSSSGSSDPNNGKMNFRNSTNGYLFTITSGVTGADIGWTLPTAAPGGANYLLNVDADGTMGYTDPSTLGGGGGVAGKVCKTITNPSDADNILFDIASARTITKISGICVGGTSAVITLQDAGADGSGSTSIDDAITMDTDGANGGTISYTIHDGDIIKLDVGTVTGVVTQVMVCYE